MAFKLDKVFNPLIQTVTGKSGSTTKKTYRYQVKVKGVQISKHYTKRAADTKAKSVRGARVSPLSKTTKRRY